VRQAFEHVTAAVRELGDRVADVARDDDVKTQARQTASSFDDALSTTVDQIVAQVSGLFGRSNRPPLDDASSESSGATSSESRSAGDDVPPAAPV
jgi:enamine deaminase RidA (YjgF/YER057c/UK114 family)